MIAHHSVSCIRAQQEPSDRSAQFRALVSGAGLTPPHTDNSIERQIDRVRSNQPEWEDEDNLSLPQSGHRNPQDESQDLSSGGTGGAVVSSLLASLLVESARKSSSTTDHWKLIVPLEQARFPDSAALIFSGPESLCVQFRSYHGSVVSMLGPIVENVGLIARQGLGRPVQCEVWQVATLALLYQ